MLAILLASAAAGALPKASAEPPSPLSVYTYSRDSVAGFQDELLDVFRRELGKHVESFTEVAYDAESAHVSVQLLGQGELTVEMGSREEPIRYLWKEDEKATRMWALVHVAGFSKEFSLEGSGMRDLGRLAKKVGDWLRANSQAIRERRRKSDSGELPQGSASRSLRRHVPGTRPGAATSLERR